MLDDSVHGYFVWIGFLKWVVFDWLCMCCFCLNLAVPSPVFHDSRGFFAVGSLSLASFF